MSCSLALPIFSNSVAAAIRTCIKTGEIKDPEAVATSDFIEKLNNLFDSLNSRRLFSKNPYNCGMSDKNPLVLSTLKNCKSFFEILIKSQSVETKSRTFGITNRKRIRESRPPCFDGIVQTINAILGLYELENQNNKSNFLLTNRLNQDFLENVFSVARQRGGWSLNPTAKAFRLSFRIQFITNILDPSKKSNCEITTLSPLISSEIKTTREQPVVEYDQPIKTGEPNSVLESCEMLSDADDVKIATDSNDLKLSLEDCAVSYYAGYLLKVTNNKFSCIKCFSDLQNETKLLTDSNQLLILYKNYGLTKTFLTCPSTELECVVKKSMDVFVNMFKTYKDQEFVALKLTNIILSRNAAWLGKKEDECYEHKVFLLSKLVHTNLFKFCKWSSQCHKKSTQKIKNIKNQ